MHVVAQKCLLYQVRMHLTLENKIHIQGNSLPESCSSSPPQRKTRNSRTLLLTPWRKENFAPVTAKSHSPDQQTLSHIDQNRLSVIWDLKDSALHTSSYCFPMLKLLHCHSSTSRFTFQAQQLGIQTHQKHAVAVIHKTSVSVTYTITQVHTTCTKSDSYCTWAMRITIIHMTTTWLLVIPGNSLRCNNSHLPISKRLHMWILLWASLLIKENILDLNLPFKRRLQNTHLTSSCTGYSHITELHAAIKDIKSSSVSN